MKKHLLLLCLSCLLPGAVMAQRKTKIIKLPDKNQEKGLALPFSEISVLPVLPDSTLLGFAQTGLANNVVPAVAETNISLFLQQYINAAYEAGYKQGGPHLLLLIKDLRINERTFAMKEKAYLRLKAESWASEDGNLYHLLGRYDTVLINGSSFGDVTASHGKNIARALRYLIEKNTPVTANADEGSFLSPNEINARAAERFSAPIYKDTSYREGVWMSYDEFLQNAPSVTNYRASVSKKTGISIYSKNQDSTESLVTPWGICKEKKLYKFTNSALIPIERDENLFVISLYLEERKRRNQSMFISAIAGGLAGGLAAGIISNGQVIYIPVYGIQHKGLLLTDIPELKNNQPEASCIEYETGVLTF